MICVSSRIWFGKCKPLLLLLYRHLNLTTACYLCHRTLLFCCFAPFTVLFIFFHRFHLVLSRAQFSTLSMLSSCIMLFYSVPFPHLCSLSHAYILWWFTHLERYMPYCYERRNHAHIINDASTRIVIITTIYLFGIQKILIFNISFLCANANRRHQPGRMFDKCVFSHSYIRKKQTDRLKEGERGKEK